MYRWHITDLVYFKEYLKVTIQALGWRSEGRYHPLQDDISSVAYWYSDNLDDVYPPLPDSNAWRSPKQNDRKAHGFTVASL